MLTTAHRLSREMIVRRGGQALRVFMAGKFGSNVQVTSALRLRHLLSICYGTAVHNPSCTDKWCALALGCVSNAATNCSTNVYCCGQPHSGLTVFWHACQVRMQHASEQ
jgi:hypothetical protein